MFGGVGFLIWFGDLVAAPRSTKSLETRIGYRFKDRTLLARALTHSSARVGRQVDGDNERLEFLGDRVLGLVVSELLLELFPTAAEGDLAKRFNHMVRGGACADVARSWEIGAHLNVSDSEAESGGRDKETILADACEAILAAIFIEAGFLKVRDIVRKHWQPRVEKLPEEAADAKSSLQEWAQSQGLALPTYTEILRVGPDHAPHFTSEVRVDAKRAARGMGASKRAAEQEAAAALLTRLRKKST
jgi:ribonuclease III